MIKRKAEQYLIDWIAKKNRKPLVLRGARQVGKTTLVRQVAEQTGFVLNEINLERHLFLDEVFKTTDIDLICRELEAILGRNVREEKSLLFFDEIQATPNAIKALRSFYEDLPDLPVIAAGSLLEFTLAEHSFSMPVGRIEYVHLFPLAFSEYLSVMEPFLVQYLAEIGTENPIPQTSHLKLLNRQRQYFFVGGMPEAVQVFKDSGSLYDVSAVHASIVNTYLDDFAKYARKQDLLLLQKVFSYVPRNLGRKVKYSNIDRDNRAQKVKEAIQLLVKARVCCKVLHSHCSGVPLHAEIAENTYKLLFLDIGLANSICGVDWSAISSMNEDQLVNEGGLAEQFVGQHLLIDAHGTSLPHLHYWLREKKSANAEVDFVVSRGGWIFPVEVKAGKSGTLKSIHQFVHQKNQHVAIRFDLNISSEQEVTFHVMAADSSQAVSFFLISLPLYGVEELPRIFDTIRKKICQKCGKKLVLKDGLNGEFLECPGCTYSKTI